MKNKTMDIKLKLKEFFRNNSKFKEDRKNVFLFTRELKNKDKKVNLKPYVVQSKFYKDYLFYRMFCDYLKELADKKGLEPYFLTLTKEFSLKEKNVYESIDYLRETVKTYRQALREIIREFQRDKDILFISVIEFNDNLFFHLHAIIFIHPLFKDKFLKILENKISLFDLGYEKEFRKIDKDQF